MNQVAKKPRSKREMREIMRKAGVKIKPVKVPVVPDGRKYTEAAGTSRETLATISGELMPIIRPEDAKKFRIGQGRMKGVPNRITKEVKDVISRCFTNIGGEEAFAAWARENKTKFYMMYSKLLPIQLQNTGPNELKIIISKKESEL